MVLIHNYTKYILYTTTVNFECAQINTHSLNQNILHIIVSIISEQNTYNDSIKHLPGMFEQWSYYLIIAQSNGPQGPNIGTQAHQFHSLSVKTDSNYSQYINN